MKRQKWMFFLVLVLGTLLMVGCGGSDENEKTPAPNQEQTQDKQAPAPKAEEPKAEEPKAEAPKAEAPKAEAPKAEAPKAEPPKTEAPKTEPPKTTSKPALNLGHDLSSAYSNCSMCHAGNAMLSKPAPHNIDKSYADCASCHTLNPKA